MTSYLNRDYAVARKQKGAKLSHSELRALRFVSNASEERLYPEVDAVVYIDRVRDRKPCAKAFRGQARNSSFNYIFRDEDQMERYLAEWVRSLKASLDYRAERAESRRAANAAPIKMKVGDLLHNSWGYDQTNCDFYQVVEVKGKSVVIRAIGSRSVPGSESYMSDRRMPDRDRFLDEKPMLKRVQRHGDGSEYLSMEFGSATPCGDDQSFHCSWYG